METKNITTALTPKCSRMKEITHLMKIMSINHSTMATTATNAPTTRSMAMTAVPVWRNKTTNNASRIHTTVSYYKTHRWNKTPSTALRAVRACVQCIAYHSS
jgi:hypothetical protein